jgi:hypothetical protein
VADPYNRDYQRRFINWADRASNSPAARMAGDEVMRQLREMNNFLDQQQAQGVVSGAEALLASEGRRVARARQQVRPGDPGE